MSARKKGAVSKTGCRKQNVLLFLKKVRGAKGGGGVQRAKRGAEEGGGQKMGGRVTESETGCRSGAKDGGGGGVQRAKRGAEGTQRAKSE